MKKNKAELPHAASEWYSVDMFMWLAPFGYLLILLNILHQGVFHFILYLFKVKLGFEPMPDNHGLEFGSEPGGGVKESG